MDFIPADIEGSPHYVGDKHAGRLRGMVFVGAPVGDDEWVAEELRFIFGKLVSLRYMASQATAVGARDPTRGKCAVPRHAKQCRARGRQCQRYFCSLQNLALPCLSFFYRKFVTVSCSMASEVRC